MTISKLTLNPGGAAEGASISGGSTLTVLGDTDVTRASLAGGGGTFLPLGDLNVSGVLTIDAWTVNAGAINIGTGNPEGLILLSNGGFLDIAESLTFLKDGGIGFIEPEEGLPLPLVRNQGNIVKSGSTFLVGESNISAPFEDNGSGTITSQAGALRLSGPTKLNNSTLQTESTGVVRLSGTSDITGELKFNLTGGHGEFNGGTHKIDGTVTSTGFMLSGPYKGRRFRAVHWIWA